MYKWLSSNHNYSSWFFLVQLRNFGEPGGSYVGLVSFSVTFSLPHVAKRDTQLQGFDIPKDSIIIANLYSAHIDQKYWKEPHMFRPERFLNDDGSLRRRDAFVPFSAGTVDLLITKSATNNSFGRRSKDVKLSC